ncbi:hypothetical protein ACOMHN_042993 [Nucella lapillus]
MMAAAQAMEEKSALECSHFFPIELPGNSPDQHRVQIETDHFVRRETEKLLLTSAGSATPGVLKCMTTLKGDTISEAGTAFLKR